MSPSMLNTPLCDDNGWAVGRAFRYEVSEVFHIIMMEDTKGASTETTAIYEARVAQTIDENQAYSLL